MKEPFQGKEERQRSGSSRQAIITAPHMTKNGDSWCIKSVGEEMASAEKRIFRLFGGFSSPVRVQRRGDGVHERYVGHHGSQSGQHGEAVVHSESLFGFLLDLLVNRGVVGNGQSPDLLRKSEEVIESVQRQNDEQQDRLVVSSERGAS